ncbi:hypothetical protein Q6A84_07545 [Aliarcobacter skirrowii]|uniref:hypothetical protein n=1 Tax=Aliarcobacter skirrowii TaxID=28200 RepID=UPI0029B0AAA2|nr:hypothetical protein [Aliarcobacter skirrowii]MDX4064044.1 hypothetical protein [Aliarcobacter skirrowii]
MPQLIAMIIIVVAAMIYMFQTFGGTGDKIEGVAQKTSVITEINNIKSGLKFAARAGKIADAYDATNLEYYNTLIGLAKDNYFAEQMNEQITTDKDGNERTDNSFNQYSAISFGGNSANAGDGTGAMLLSLVANAPGAIPGIFVDLSRGSLKNNAGFLEAEIANDLKGIATIDRLAAVSNAGGTFSSATALRTTADTAAEQRVPVAATGGTNSDGMFVIYFNDFGSSELVVNK